MRTGYHRNLAPLLPELSRARCRGNPDFTSERPKRPRDLVATCRDCPEIAPCRAYLDDYRTQDEWRHARFSGVWAGLQFHCGRSMP